MKKTLRAWAKEAAANTLLAVVSLALCYLIGEVVFFRLVLPYVQLNIRPHLPEIPEILLQNTKSGYLPHNYIALLGDSYAEGLGDWLWDLKGNESLPHHSANIIHDETGRDVVSFGKGGSGSAEGLIKRPAAIFSHSRCYLFPSIEEPVRIFYYFFEGNDLEDNRDTLTWVGQKYGNTDPASIAKYLDGYANPSPWQCHASFGDTIYRMARFAYNYYIQKKDFYHGPPLYTLRFGAQLVPTSALEGPALALKPEEIDLALSLFDPSLAWLRKRFPNAPISVVYVPSPLIVYVSHLTHPLKLWYIRSNKILAVEDSDSGPGIGWMVQRSEEICAHIRAVTNANGAEFINATPALRKAAELRPIHGPNDWEHPNEYGYRALGGLVVERLKGGAVSGDCNKPE